MSTDDSASAEARSFLVKFNGEVHGPNNICRPKAASDWEGGTVKLLLDGAHHTYTMDREAGPEIEPSDRLFLWTHEDRDYGNGLGMTGRARVEAVDREGSESHFIRIRDVELLPRPFGLLTLEQGFLSGLDLPLALRNIHAVRSPRAWALGPGDHAELEAFIAEVGRRLEARIADAASQDPWDEALIAQKQAIMEAEADRRTAVTKAHPDQQQFRAAAIDRHGGRCVFTKYRVPEALEAAHVIPHTGEPLFERPDNALLLRRDLHALFDAGLIAIRPATDRLAVAGALTETPYGKLKGREVRHKLAAAPLQYQWKRFGKG